MIGSKPRRSQAKPDWAERAVAKMLADFTLMPHDNKGIWCCIKQADLLKLLRAERRRVVRMVRGRIQEYRKEQRRCPMYDDIIQYQIDTLTSLLAALRGRDETAKP